VHGGRGDRLGHPRYPDQPVRGRARFQTNSYTFSNTTAYRQYRLRVTANNGATTRFQIAELQLF
jgi:hypothetical protein